MTQTTQAQFRTRIAAKLGLDNTSGSDEQGLIDSWIEEAREDVLVRTHCNVKAADMDLTSGENNYTLPTGILAILDIYNTASSNEYLMERLTVTEILDRRRATGTGPARYYSVQGTNLLMVYPTPGAGETVTIYYVPRPTALATTATSPDEIPYEYHKLVEYYALSEGADYGDDQSSGMGQLYLARYLEGVTRLKKALRRKGGNRLAPARAGSRPRRALLSNNSQDLWDR